MGPGRSGRAYSRVCGAATAKGSEHVRVRRRQDPREDHGNTTSATPSRLRRALLRRDAGALPRPGASSLEPDAPRLTGAALIRPPPRLVDPRPVAGAGDHRVQAPSTPDPVG